MSSYLLVIEDKTNRIARLFKDLSDRERNRINRVLFKRYPTGQYSESYFISDNPWSYLAEHPNTDEFRGQIRGGPTRRREYADLFAPA